MAHRHTGGRASCRTRRRRLDRCRQVWRRQICRVHAHGPASFSSRTPIRLTRWHSGRPAQHAITRPGILLGHDRYVRRPASSRTLLRRLGQRRRTRRQRPPIGGVPTHTDPHSFAHTTGRTSWATGPTRRLTAWSCSGDWPNTARPRPSPHIKTSLSGPYTTLWGSRADETR